MTIELGDVARDTVSGFEGVAIARTIWLNNCDRITLQPKVGKDGKLPDSATFDEPDLALVKAGPRHEKVKTGGPRPEPTRASVPR